MAEIIHGQACLYGIDGRISQCAVQSVTHKFSFANVSEVVDEQGNRVSKRYDDISEDITIEIIPFTGYGMPAIGSWIYYKGVKYIIESIDSKREAKGFARYTLTCVKHEYIKPPTA